MEERNTPNSNQSTDSLLLSPNIKYRKYYSVEKDPANN